MERVINISKNAKDAQQWDIKQQLSMSVENVNMLPAFSKREYMANICRISEKLNVTNESVSLFQRLP